MKLISTENGQTFQLLATEDVRPPSGLYWPDFSRLIIDRYGFVVSPSMDEILKDGAKFAHGRLIRDGKLIEIKEFNVYSDGIIVITWNTDDSNTVLDDFASWTVESLGFRQPVFLRPRRFQSSVIIEFDFSVDSILTPFQELVDQFSRIIQDEQGITAAPTASRIAFSIDPAVLPRFMSFEFRLERRANSLPSQNRYFSFANLSTSQHLELLAQLERRLSSLGHHSVSLGHRVSN